MKANRILLIICAFLLVSNFIWLFVFFYSKKDKTILQSNKRNLSITKSLQREVGFDSTQMAKFYLLRERHSRELRPLFENLSRRKKEFYRLLGKTTPDDSLTIIKGRGIGEMQTDVDLQIFRNLSEIESICRAEQKPIFDSVIIEIINKKWLGREN
jgi:hypothetical protein